MVSKIPELKSPFHRDTFLAMVRKASRVVIETENNLGSFDTSCFPAEDVYAVLGAPEDHTDGEKCDSCGRRYQIVYIVPNEVWAKITPRPDQLGEHPEHQLGGLLCPDCASERASEIGITLCFEAGSSAWASDEAYARGVRDAAEVCAQTHNNFLLSKEKPSGAYALGYAKANILALLLADQPAPAMDVREAARVLADHMQERRWAAYPIIMPITKDGRGPATIGEDADSVLFEVWDATTLSAISSHEHLPDAIEAALRAIAKPNS